MQSIRIFISSPRDVGGERALALRVLERLQLEFRSRVVLDPIFWEHEVLLATETFQSQIPAPSKADLCVFILWSWFGTPLPETIRRPDGSLYHSGTEFEFEDALAGFRAKGTPDILVYRKTADVPMPTRDRAKELELRAQRDALHDFLDRWFRGEGGSFKAAFNEFETQQQFEDAFETHLRRWLEDRLRGAEPRSDAHEGTVWKGTPYRGLERFDFEHALIFCGRTQAVSEAIDALRRQSEKGSPFQLVVGMSGVGKSSFVCAGVLPMLVQPRVIEGDIAWRRAILRPTDVPGAPFESLAAAILADDALSELAQGGISRAELTTMLSTRPESVLPLMTLALSGVAQKQGHAAKTAKLIVVVDQLDELFTQTAVAAETRNAFATALVTLARSGNVWVICTLRADLFARIADLPEAFRDLAHGDGFYELRAPSPAEIGQMIRRPARMAGLTFERRADTDEGLDDILRDAAAAQPTSLPLLEFALDELQKSCRETRELTFAAYAALGELEGALRKRAEDTFAALPSQAQAALPAILARLVHVGLDGTIAQTRARLDKLREIGGADVLIDAFVQARLFVVDRAAEGHAVLGLAHEALLREWTSTRDWIEQNRTALEARGRIDAAMALQEGLLLPPGRLLDDGASLLKDHRDLLGDAEAGFIQASLDRLSSERRRRRMIYAAAAAVAAVALVGASAYWDSYVREHDAYYTSITKRWGVFNGVGVISASDASKRDNTFHMFRRGRYGQVFKFDIINGSGACPPVSTLTLYIGDFSGRDYTSKRLCYWDFDLDNEGHSRSENAFDAEHRPVFSFRYSNKGGTTAEYYTADGYASAGSSSGASRVVFDRIPSGPQAGLDQGLTFVDAYGHPKQNHRRVYGYHEDFNDGSRLLRSTNLDRDGHPTADVDGIVTIAVGYDNDEVVSQGYLGIDGKPAYGSSGFATAAFTRDAFGNTILVRYLGPDGQSATVSAGYSSIRTDRDQHGNETSEQYFDLDGKLTRLYSGASKMRVKNDAHGQWVERTYLDENDHPIATTLSCPSTRRTYTAAGDVAREQCVDADGNLRLQLAYTYDDQGLPVDEAFLDAEDHPAEVRAGYAALHLTYRNGRETERVYLDLNKHPAKINEGYARITRSYDERGNLVELRYFDERNQPTMLPGGYAAIKRVYTDLGDIEDETYLDIDDNPVLLPAGYARVHKRFDQLGRATEVTYFTAANRFVWPKDDCASRRRYDQWGRLATLSCIDENLKVTSHPDGWVRSDMSYNPAGNPVSTSYYDANGTLAHTRSGVAVIETKNDPWGNALETRFLDADRKPGKNLDGCYVIRRTFDRLNKMTNETCLDDHGNPIARKSANAVPQ